MKKFFLLLLFTSSLFTLVGCGNDEEPQDNEEIEDVEEEDEIGDGEIDDE